MGRRKRTHNNDSSLSFEKGFFKLKEIDAVKGSINTGPDSDPRMNKKYRRLLKTIEPSPWSKTEE
jgi:hypothetical protein